MRENTLPAVLAALIVLTAVVPAGAAAAGEKTGVMGTDLLDGEDDGTDIGAFASGLVTQAQYRASALMDDSATNPAKTDANNLENVINNNSAALVNWSNQHQPVEQAASTIGATEQSPGHIVAELTFKRAGSEATRYAVAGYNSTSGNLTSLKVVESTSKATDTSMTLPSFASAQADDEVQHVLENAVAEDRDVTEKYESKLMGRYFRLVEAPFLPDSTSVITGVISG